MNNAAMARGADLGWLSWLESRGFRWQNSQNQPVEPLEWLRQCGLDAARLRVMVDPDLSTGVGFADQASVAAMAGRCQAAGLSRLMIDFHLSDTWADPAKQFIPARWRGDSLQEMAAHVGSHVTEVLSALRAAGVTPEWVQIGNEIPNGLLWASEPGEPGGKVEGADGWNSLALLINAGHDAVKRVSSDIQTVVHLDRGYDSALYRNWFDRFQAAGGRWDVTGLSFYPHWQPEGTLEQLRENLHDMASRYDRPVVLGEVGGRADDPDGTFELLVRAQETVASVPGGRGQGVFYWEPVASPEAVGGYLLGAAVSDGPLTLRFTRAMEAFEARGSK